jgi:hypothetical protein
LPGLQVVLWACSCSSYPLWKHRTAWSYFFPPAQLGDFMLGVAAAALALRAVADAPAPGEVAPLQGTTKDGAASEGAKAGAWVARWARESWVGLLADAAVLTVACLIVLLPMVGRENSTGWEPLLQHALAPLFALWCAAHSVVLGPLAAPAHRTLPRMPGCSLPQSGAPPRPVGSRECCATQRWPAWASTASTCTCCTLLSYLS